MTLDASRLDPVHSDSALSHTLAQLVDASRAPGERLVVGVAGESGSGKSVTATRLAGALRERGVPTEVLHQDDYFLRPPRRNHLHRERDLASVGPHEVDLGALSADIARFRERQREVQVPAVNYADDRFDVRVVDFSAVDALVVEGTYVLTLDRLDFRIFLEATALETRERRRLRNRDIDAPFVDQVLEIEHALIAPQAQLADVLIDGGFSIVRSRTRHPSGPSR